MGAPMSVSIIAPVSLQTQQSFEAEIKAEILLHCHNAGAQLYDVLCYHFQHMGSCQRAILCYQTAQSLGIDHQPSLKLAAIVEILHNASLIHDDIQDKDTMRRESLSLWFKYGQDIALCAGDSLILSACQLAAEVSTSSAASLSSIVSLAAQRTIRGQVADLSSSTQLSSGSYRAVACDKAAPLIQLALQLPCMFCNQLQSLDTLTLAAKDFAIAYQLYDDIMDLEMDIASHQPNAVSLHLYETKERAVDDAVDMAKNAILQEIHQLLDDGEARLAGIQGGLPKPLYYCMQKLRQRLASL